MLPGHLKDADVLHIHKKEERTKKENYRPVWLLPTIAKSFERDMYIQIIGYIEKYLYPYLCGFRKGHSTEQSLNVMIERRKKLLIKKKIEAVLTDLSKAFDCLNHQLLIAKLEAYGFEKEALSIIYDYLAKRNQRTKINSSFNSRREVKTGVPQGSILGPLLFNIIINDIFLFIENTKIANYADDNIAIETMEHDTNIVLTWFKMNEMKSNNDKRNLLIINNDNNYIQIFTCIQMYTCIGMYTYREMYACIQMYTCVEMYTCIQMKTCIHVYICIHLYICIHAYRRIHAYFCIHVYKRIHVYRCTHAYICIHVYRFIHV